MSGHSFGAHTTQAVAGQAFGRGLAGRQSLREPRIDAAIAFSPAPPRAAEDAQRRAFATVEIPFFSITGTADEVRELTDVSAADRTLPFRYMPAGAKYLLVFDGAEHNAFSGNTLLRRRGAAADPGLVEAVRASTTAFWRAILLGDEGAQEWLDGDGVASLLGPVDRFERR
jgi:predicted dienelactone hydrolase